MAKVGILIDKPSFSAAREGRLLTGFEANLLAEKAARAGLLPDDYEVRSLVGQPALTVPANIIVTMGEAALREATGKKSIWKWHLSPLDPVIMAAPGIQCAKFIPTFDFQQMFKDWSLTLYFEMALKRAAANATPGPWVRKEENYVLGPAPDEAIARLEAMLARPPEWFSIDIETGRNQINTFGIATSPNEAIAIKVLPGGMSPHVHYKLWECIARLCQSDVPKVMQNGIYERTYLSRYGIAIRNFQHDTMCANKFLWPELEKGLDNVGRIYTMEPYWKDDGRVASEAGKRKDWGNIRDWNAHFRYNCADTSNTLTAMHAQRRDLASRNLLTLHDSYLRRLYDPVFEMGSRGLPLNPVRQAALIADFEQRSAALVRELSQEINPRSPKAKAKLLKDKGYALPVKRATGKESTDELSLKRLRLKHPDDRDLALLLEIAGLEKALSSYLRVCTLPDRRIRFMLDAHGTETGRFCLRGGTMVAMPSGDTPIEKVSVGDLVYCYDNNRNLQLSRVLWAGKTGHRKLLRVHWRTNMGATGHIDCTEEHQFRLINGSYLAAVKLAPGMRTLALRRMLDSGYMKLWCYGKKVREHAFVFEALYGWRPETVHHRDGNKLNNHPANLDGLSIAQHVREHALADGRKPPQPSITQRARGSRIGTSKLTEADVREIKTLLQQGHTAAALAKQFKIGRETIGLIRNGKRWADVEVNNHIIDRIEVLNETADVFDLEVEHWHNFIANEVCVHNSCSNDPWGAGFNAQTMTAEVKRMIEWRPEEGRVFVEIDLRQAESRFVAFDACEETLLGMLERDEDIHRFVAAEIYGIPMADVTHEQRQLGKKSGHGANYSMGVSTFQDSCLKEMDLVIGRRMATRVLESYHRLFPGIRRWHAKIREVVYRERRLTNPLGRVRYFYGRTDDNTYREAYAYRPQSTIPDCVNHLMLKLCDERSAGVLDFWLHMQCHDSLLISCTAEQAPWLMEFAHNTALWHPEIILPAGRLIIPTECKFGTCLGEMKKWNGVAA